MVKIKKITLQLFWHILETAIWCTVSVNDVIWFTIGGFNYFPAQGHQQKVKDQFTKLTNVTFMALKHRIMYSGDNNKTFNWTNTIEPAIAVSGRKCSCRIPWGFNKSHLQSSPLTCRVVLTAFLMSITLPALTTAFGNLFRNWSIVNFLPVKHEVTQEVSHVDNSEHGSGQACLYTHRVQWMSCCWLHRQWGPFPVTGTKASWWWTLHVDGRVPVKTR